jgi:hypothetical protein
MLLLWAYLHAMQYIIIWAGNIPGEMVWYLTRLDAGWAYAVTVLSIGQFVLPFFALLSAGIRTSTRALLWIAGATLAFRLLEAALLVLPPLRTETLALLLALPSATLAVAASWLMAWRVAPALWTRWLRHPAPALQ